MLERRRKIHLKHHRLVIAFILALILHFPLLFIENDLIRPILQQLLIIINIVLSYFTFFKYKNDERLYHDYRKRIIPKLLVNIDKTYKYYPRGKILAKEFVSSGLYYNKLSKLNRKDLILGMVKKAAFSISYVKAQTMEILGKSSITYASNSVSETKFQGLHYVFKVPLSLLGKTIILPLSPCDDKLLHHINQQNLESRLRNVKTKRITTGHREFDQLFAVFSSSEKGTDQFLTRNRMDDILKINDLFRHTIALSFFGSFVFLHAHTNKEIFKLDVNKIIDVEQVVHNYLNLLIVIRAAKILLN